MEAVHRAKLLLLLADFSGVKSAVPAIVARYKVQPGPHDAHTYHFRKLWYVSRWTAKHNMHCANPATGNILATSPFVSGLHSINTSLL